MEAGDFRRYNFTEARIIRLIEQGRCPRCELRFESPFHDCGVTLEQVIHIIKL